MPFQPVRVLFIAADLIDLSTCGEMTSTQRRMPKFPVGEHASVKNEFEHATPIYR